MNDAQVITVQGEQITEDEIAGFHSDPRGGFWIILSNYCYTHNGHQSLDYHVNPDDPGYAETQALYKSMFTVTADTEYPDVVYFRARNAYGLQPLYDYLEQGGYGFTFLLGATRDNYIRVYRKQSRIRSQARKLWMKQLITEYATPQSE